MHIKPVVNSDAYAIINTGTIFFRQSLILGQKFKKANKTITFETIFPQSDNVKL